jgi:uncharacterized membrane protein YfcA
VSNFESIVLVAAVFLLAGSVKGMLGLGIPIVVLACLSATLGLKETMGLIIVPGIVTNVWQALAGGAFFPIVRRLRTLLLASVAGIWAGTQILTVADPVILTAILGTLLFVYSATSLMRPRIPSPGKREWIFSPLMGAAGGLTFGMTGSYMVPGVLYIEALDMPRDEFVQALGIVFCLIMIVLGLFMSRYQILPPETALMSAAAMVPTSLGMILGQRLRHRLTDRGFRKAFFVALSLVGLYMILRAML